PVLRSVPASGPGRADPPARYFSAVRLSTRVGARRESKLERAIPAARASDVRQRVRSAVRLFVRSMALSGDGDGGAGQPRWSGLRRGQFLAATFVVSPRVDLAAGIHCLSESSLSS